MTPLEIRYFDTKPKELKGMNPILTTSAKDYLYSKIDFFIKDIDLYIRLSGTGIKGLKAKWLVIKHFEKYTALDVISQTDYGRHFKDGVLQIWKEKELPFGWVRCYVSKKIKCLS